MRRRKKVISAVVAGAMIAAQMAMPVMAEGGSLDVDVTVETGVVRVTVPTTMKIAIDQFETQGGTQIYVPDPFTIVNNSEMDVKVEVTSKAKLGTGVKLVSSVDEAKNSSATEAWLAIAAQTAEDEYDDPATASDTETIKSLTETNKNVTTFGSDATAKQTFYLAKGDKTKVTYTSEIPSENGKAGVSYAKFYELKEIATQPTDDASLNLLAEDNDVYAIVSANAGTTGQAVTKIGKGTTATWAGTNKYYTMESTETAMKDLSTSKIYAYASAAKASAGGEAAFTYIGKLSSAKEKWVQSDISQISIAYDITGVPGSDYDNVKSECTYGLWTSKAPYMVKTSYTSASGVDLDMQVNLGESPKDATGIASITYTGASGATKTVDAANYELSTDKTTLTLKAAVNTASRTYTITFDDAAATTAKVKVTIK